MRNRLKCSVENQHGQAVVEYVLLLVVVVSLITGLRGVFSSVNTFMSDFMGEYVVCLMEYGELPALGAENADLKKHKDGAGRKCEFRKVTGATSFGPSSGSGSTTGSSGTTGSGSSKNGSNPSTGSTSGSSNANNGSKNQNSGRNQGSSSGDSNSKVGGRAASPYSNGNISRSSSYSSADSPSAGKGKVKVLEDESLGRGRKNGAGDAGRPNQRRTAFQNGKYRAITGGMAEQIDKQSKMRPRKPSSSVIAVSEEGYRFVPQKRTFNPPKGDAPKEESKDDGLDFGSFMKWIIIAGIVIAAFVLFGGQVMNYSNSDN